MATKKVIEINPVEVEMKLAMDNQIEQIRAEQQLIAEITAIAEMKIKAIKEQLEEKLYPHKNNLEMLIGSLRGYFEMLPSAETKTQRKITLLSGDVVLKKATTKLAHDDVKLLEWAEEQRLEDFIKTKETRSFKWSEFKEILTINNGSIVNMQTGETLEIPGLEIEVVPEHLEVK